MLRQNEEFEGEGVAGGRAAFGGALLGV